MNTIRHALAGLSLAALSASVLAGQHQICYQDQHWSSTGTPIGIVGCRQDAAGSCAITRPNGVDQINANDPGPYLPAAPQGTFGIYSLPNDASSEFTITFRDANGNQIGQPRKCRISSKSSGNQTRGSASENAQLTGFTTDASGIVTTGVWRKTKAPETNTFSRYYQNLTVYVPYGFTAVGGGVTGADLPYGAYLFKNGRGLGGIAGVNTWRKWSGGTSDVAGYPNPHPITVYAIGMQITGLPQECSTYQAQCIDNLIWQKAGVSTDASIPHSQVDYVARYTTKLPYVPLSSETIATALTASTHGQFITASRPLIDSTASPPISGWMSASKDHLEIAPGNITTNVIALPSSIQIGIKQYRVESKVVSATTKFQVAHPSISVGGLSGEYALTGVGAFVNWETSLSPYGNLLWKLEPRPDLGGVSVASKDHGVSSPAWITGYALGIKLVPLP
jgi:hypothetical protein